MRRNDETAGDARSRGGPAHPAVASRAARRPGLALALVLTLAPARALGHGVPASITGVAALRGGEATVLTTTEGLALRRDGRLRYVCPAQFGSELSPPALSADGERTFVVGSTDLFTLDADGAVTPLSRPDLSRRSVVALLAGPDGVVALRFTDGRTELARVADAGAAAFWTATAPVDSVTAAADGYWVARAEGGAGFVGHVGADGSAAAERELALDPGERITRVTEAEGTLWIASVTSDLGGRLRALPPDGPATLVAGAPAPFDGPVAVSPGGIVVAEQGQLALATGGGTAPLGDTFETCLGVLGGTPYLCSRSLLLALGADGPGSSLASLAELEPPDLDLVDAGVRADCSLQWSTFQGDLRSLGVLPLPESGAEREPPASPSPHDDGGCAVARGREPRGPGPWLVVAAALLTARAFRSSSRCRTRRGTSRRASSRP